MNSNLRAILGLGNAPIREVTLIHERKFIL